MPTKHEIVINLTSMQNNDDTIHYPWALDISDSHDNVTIEVENLDKKNFNCILRWQKSNRES